MDIVLLGLSQPRLQHLAAALGPALKQFASNWDLHTPLDTPLSHPVWTPPSLSSRILLCASPEDAPNAQAWRTILLAQGLPFQVIHGIGQELVTQCLLALLPPDCFSPSCFAMTNPMASTPPSGFAIPTQVASAFQGLARQALPVRWQGVCETCSDPDCELRLFSGLLQGR
jgi:hypothetical protein